MSASQDSPVIWGYWVSRCSVVASCFPVVTVGNLRKARTVEDLFLSILLSVCFRIFFPESVTMVTINLSFVNSISLVLTHWCSVSCLCY